MWGLYTCTKFAICFSCDKWIIGRKHVKNIIVVLCKAVVGFDRIVMCGR